MIMKYVEEDDLASLSDGSAEEQVSIANLPDKVDLVDLIDQPAWKTILIELVRTERMDPWSIDIAALAEKYLQKINLLTGTDLRLPANAILASAILLKFKSNVLHVSEIEDEEDFSAQKKEMTPEERAEFEALIPDLKSIRKIKEGKVSLEELVSSIERMLQSTKKIKDKNILRERTRFQLPFSDFQIEKEMNRVFKVIEKNVDSQGLIVFSRLLRETDTPEQIVRTFIPCLFLTNKGKINMWQDVFFGEIFLSLNTVKGSEKS